jgi:hypothetical protein
MLSMPWVWSVEVPERPTTQQSCRGYPLVTDDSPTRLATERPAILSLERMA